MSWSCASRASLQPLPPIPDAAQAAFVRARELKAQGAATDSPSLWGELRKARELAPDWIAPARFEDDLLAADLRSIAALERRRVASSERPEDPSALYLLRRLEGRRDLPTWERVLRAEPRSAWAQQAFAWASALAGQDALATLAWRRAIGLARTPFDRVHFILGFANYLFSRHQWVEARDVLQSFVESEELSPALRARLRMGLALSGMDSSSEPERRRGYLQGLEYVAEAQAAPLDLKRLVPKMLERYSVDDPTHSRLEEALESWDSDVRRELLVQLWLRFGARPYAEALAHKTGQPRLVELTRPLPSFKDSLQEHQPVQALNLWLASLPGQVLEPDGLPRDPGLRAMAAAAHGTLAANFDLHSLVVFARSLLAVGWYDEALVLAAWIVEYDLDLARALKIEAGAGRGLFLRLQRLLRDVEQESQELELPGGEALAAAEHLASLDDLLGRFGLAFSQASGAHLAAPEGDGERAQFSDSPRLGFGPLGQLVHPGPRFSEADEARGLGPAGSAVPGMAAAMARTGRFAIVGEVLGAGGPDAMILRRVLAEERAGVHLGVPWHGTVAWCDGVDVLSRAARGEARIAGAALHEGYWIDLAALRRVHEGWQNLRRLFDGEATDEHASGRLARALDVQGLRLQTPRTRPIARRRERLRMRPALEESLRLQLVLMRERAPQDRLLGEIRFEEVVELTAVHEEGHLCDQTRFLPALQNLGALFLFALEQAFSAPAIRERLEYRAELTALCEVPDPRLSLVNLLEAAAASGASELGHGPAYRQLLRNLLRRLDRQLEADPAAWPELSSDHVLLHQLHRLPPEKLRQLAREEARSEGLLRGPL